MATAAPTSTLSLTSPATKISDDTDTQLQDGIAVCLSGGGYRAMLFHLGSLWRLAELGLFDPQDRSTKAPDGSSVFLGRIERISSVSGGSIISALLGLRWNEIQFGSAGALDRFRRLVAQPIRDLAGVSLAGTDAKGAVAVVGDILLPGSVNDHLAAAYEKRLYHGATLQALPDTPRFVINASNLQSGALWRFMKPYMRDWRVGEVRDTGKVTLAKAVAASSAFPPILAPATLQFEEADYTPNSGGDGLNNLQRPPYTTEPTLADGGVYDNLGLETAYKRYKTLLVGNSGAPFEFQASVPHDWVRIGQRVIALIDNQVGALRKRLLMDALQRRERLGAFWTIEQPIGVHQCPDALPCDPARTLQLAHVPTDLAAKEPALQERLINWGYALTDAAVRVRIDCPGAGPGFPFAGGV